jgi:hypothetical protein
MSQYQQVAKLMKYFILPRAIMIKTGRQHCIILKCHTVFCHI